jgi:hypothetical protein
MEEPAGQLKRHLPEAMKPFMFKPGVSGNPSGMKKGTKSMKTWAREYLESLPEEERAEFLNSQHSGLVWQMAEGSPTTKIDATVTNSIKFTPEQIDATRKALGLGPIGIDGSSK